MPPSRQSGPTLRLTQTAAGADRYQVEVALEGPGQPRQTAVTTFEFTLGEQDREHLRWYFEDYLQYPADPAPKLAADVERGMAKIGTLLFDALFESSRDARDLWATLRAHLSDTRIEIITGVREAAAIPWELLRDPQTDAPLALRARAFVRAQPNAAQRPQLPRATGPIRILLVICRPRGDEDVPFRSVASRLVKSLSEEARAVFQLDVLRPPTKQQLGQTLHAAKAAGKPYHVVHFDGHGVYAAPGEAVSRLSRSIFADNRSGKHGYLAFENAALQENIELVDGLFVGKLLAETGVPVLVLNACRSAHAEEEPRAEDGGPRTESLPRTADNPHQQVRAFGSLAQEVMDAGAAGVVAMRYNVYVVTAAQFVADLYAALTQGQTLGEAATLGRKQLHAQPLREIAAEPRELQDWPVPIVYEAAPFALFPRPKKATKLNITVHAADAVPARGSLDAGLPARPDAGFFGRDETLLALDRAFDREQIVLLHAYAGSGKTSTAAEFARWYALTGGVEGPVLWSSFEQPKSLPRVLDAVGQVLGGLLEQNNIHWLTLDDAQRRSVALQVLRVYPVLWVWDNVEPIAGFPSAADAALSAMEQRELAEFLRAARESQAKFLLTSRRDERGWLGDLPMRIAVPPMPMQERGQLARALVQRHRRRLTSVDLVAWQPLLWYTQGNPMTLTVLVNQALRAGLRTKEQIRAFVDRLRAGEAAFEDETSERRSKSLGASLSYGFAHAFSEDERKVLALLHLFQGFVNVNVLRQMGHPQADYCLPEVRGLAREAGVALLDRAVDGGLLNAHGGGYYGIHPALPWYFKGLFDRYYPPSAERQGDKDITDNGQPTTDNTATRAFVEAIGTLGDYYTHQYESGNRNVIGALATEEANLLHAYWLAQAGGWWRYVISAMQGLRTLYDHTGRRAEWQRLVDEIVPDFIDPTNGGPLPGREEEWGFVTQYRVRFAREARQWAEAERLQRACVEWARWHAAPTLAAPPNVLDARQRNTIRTLAASLHELGEIQRELGQPECVAAYEEALRLSEDIGEQAMAAVCALNLGTVYKDVPSLRNLAQAEHWYRRSLELRSERDRQGRAKCLMQLGFVPWEQFKEVRAAGQPEEDLLHHLNAAAQFYREALDLLPPNAVDDLAITHHQFGSIYGDAGDLDRALSHYRESIRYKEVAGNLYSAATTRFNVAVDLVNAGRRADALLYAQAALRNFATYGDRAAAEMQKTQRLIERIERAMRGSPDG